MCKEKERDAFAICVYFHWHIYTHVYIYEYIYIWHFKWYIAQVLGTTHLVPSTWHKVLGTKYLVATKYLVPSTWYQVLGCLLACLLSQGGKGPQGALIGCFSKGFAFDSTSVRLLFRAVLRGLPCLPSLISESALGAWQESTLPDGPLTEVRVERGVGVWWGHELVWGQLRMGTISGS